MDGNDQKGIRTADFRLLRLVRAQHRQDVSRASVARGTTAWDDATTRLDTLNDQVFLLASTGMLRREPLGYQLDLELDSRPEEDLAFRASVVASVRRTVLARVTEDLTVRSRDRLHASDAEVPATRSLLDRIEARLRTEYPDGSFNARASNRTTISLIAQRDGLIA
jgi:hypothetical protein